MSNQQITRQPAAGELQPIVGNKEYRDQVLLRLQRPMALTFGETPEAKARFHRLHQSFMTGLMKLGPKVFKCDTISLLDAYSKCITYRMETDGLLGRAYLIPRSVTNWRKGERGEWIKDQHTQLQFQLGYKGVVELFYRANPGAVVTTGVVYEGDKFEYQLGSDGHARLFSLGARKPGTQKFFYSSYRLPSGLGDVHVMTIEEMLAHSDQFRADRERFEEEQKKNASKYLGTWDKHFDAMGKKSCTVMGLKYAPMDPESQAKLVEDEYRETGEFKIQATESIDLDNGIVGAMLENTDMPPDDEPPEGAEKPAPEQPKNGDNARRMTMRTKNPPAPAAEPSPTDQSGGDAGAALFDQGGGSAPAAKEKGSGRRKQSTAAPAPAGYDPKLQEEAAAAKEKLDATADAAAGRAPAADENTPAKIDWMKMPDREVEELLVTLDKEEMMRHWRQATPAEQKRLGDINKAMMARREGEAEAPAEVDDDAVQAQHRKRAEEHVKPMEPDPQLAWVLTARTPVPDATRDEFLELVGAKPGTFLKELDADKVQEYAILVAHWLLEKGKPLPPRTPAPSAPQQSGGRPGPKRT